MRYALLVVPFVLIVGCGTRPTSQRETAPVGAQPAAHDHGLEGPHKGALAEWGAHDYHAEFTVDHAAKEATVYILDGDAKNAKPIAAKQLTVALAEQPAVTFTLVPKAQPGDPTGTASRFVGTHEFLATKKALAGTISAQVDGKPYSGSFKETAHDDHAGDHPAPPSAKPSQKEQEVFLTPGGIYTRADIEKNGSTVPSVKYRGVSFDHDDDLKPGDKVCPVTVNKADEKCKWWVNGKQYQFCCAPCLEKFVKQAKETPEKIKDPSEYIKK
ncbi:hypothetical protein [Frigoriglobus tundricola]|uniref:TRASH domain-containing protein n=1 Tax=Frigoriglobus tundricola TaxID=2774151 RepID=A0A6M5YZ78_9BACT|nr:hypothetical protein [Frigoriglobus tundricola]QJW99437.1 hypothetical protein FTUN_7049 [Frigoriglobus tundricola]